MAEPTEPLADNEIVCACVNLTQADIKRLVAGRKSSFEEFLNSSGAGQRCTACLLDLEYCFVKFNAGDAGGGGTTAAHSPESPQDLGFRRRLWRFIDRLCPPVPLSLPNSAIIIAGAGVRQSVVVANDSMLFEDAIAAPPMHVDLVVRDGEGRVRHESRHHLGTNEELRHDVSQYLDAPRNGSLAIGSVVVERRALRPGYRGTTRPQILVEAPSGCCAVHTQAAHGPGDLWFAYHHRPPDQRLFMGLVNHTGRPMAFRMSYPLDPIGTPDVDPIQEQVTVPPRGSRLHEVVVPGESVAKLGDRLLRLRCRSTAPGGRKVSFICASPGLDAFSIDHPSG